MALIECEECCSQQVSDQERACPPCEALTHEELRASCRCDRRKGVSRMVRPMAFSVVLAAISLILATTPEAEADQFDVSVCAAYQDAQSRNQCCDELNVPPSQCKYVAQPSIGTSARTSAPAPEEVPRQTKRQITTTGEENTESKEDLQQMPEMWLASRRNG